jgi:ABC-type transporter lipoprotein component MlaA
MKICRHPSGCHGPALACCVALLAGAVGCTTIETRHKDWSGYDGPGAGYFTKEELAFPRVADPLEPTNRVMSWINYAVLSNVLAPLGTAYRWTVPLPVREALGNFGTNIRYPVRVVSALLQGDLAGSWDETRRFAVNTTVGVIGLRDPATAWGLPASDEDLGQAMAKWGWTDSRYIFIPLLGPSTVRDALGSLGNMALSPLSYYPPAPMIDAFNRQSDEFEPILRTIRASFDAYQLGRVLYLLQRDAKATNFHESGDDSAEVQTLDVLFLDAEDPDFAGRAETHAVRLPSSGRLLPYSLWLQPESAAVLYVLPGLAGHRTGPSALGIAEAAYGFGLSVVTISSTMNREFMEFGATTPIPGYLPIDALDVHAALDAIDRDLGRRHPDRIESKILLGISLGGCHALAIAAAESPGAPGEERAPRVLFDVYVALDAPVDLEHVVRRLDAFYNAPMDFPAPQREVRVEAILAKVASLSKGSLLPTDAMPFSRSEAEFLIGLAFRWDLQCALLSSQERVDLGVLQTRRSPFQMEPAFREAAEYSFMEYIYAFVLPYYAGREEGIGLDEAGARRLFERCDLRSIGDALRTNGNVRYFANENDFLLKPEDIAWAKDVFGERATFFPAGGHLGNLHRTDVQDTIRAIVDRAEVDAAVDDRTTAPEGAPPDIGGRAP